MVSMMQCLNVLQVFHDMFNDACFYHLHFLVHISICNNQGRRSCATTQQEVAVNFGPGC